MISLWIVGESDLPSFNEPSSCHDRLDQRTNTTQVKSIANHLPSQLSMELHSFIIKHEG